MEIEKTIKEKQEEIRKLKEQARKEKKTKKEAERKAREAKKAGLSGVKEKLDKIMQLVYAYKKMGVRKKIETNVLQDIADVLYVEKDAERE